MNLLWKWEGDKIIKFWTKSSTFKIIFSLTRFEATNKRRHTFLALEEAWPPWAESQEASLCLSPKSKYFYLNFEVLFWTTMQKPFFFILGNTFVPVLSLIPRFPLFRWQGCLAKSGCKKWKNILRCKKLSEEFQLVDWPKFCCPGQVSGEPKGVPCPTLRASSQSPPDHISYFKHLLDPASYFKHLLDPESKVPVTRSTCMKRRPFGSMASPSVCEGLSPTCHGVHCCCCSISNI